MAYYPSQAPHTERTREILKEMQTLERKPMCDYEADHVQADKLMVEIVRIMGYNDIADAFVKVGKWYA